ncbi:3-keto-5-aminohexanoate cleavage protein [Paracoccus pantotrophus]|uniref:3-keto-5-aminohexanoate cleavage protein n=1 Tax=Paracoccus pantotrophus TaxID=82367 RepID=A0A7H9BQK8_PARPN|nr:3-keto-5-aminohexanoate cleavage protein [Paracoccus pantotrophus]QLH13008.1 3-keto-5-aminohexanoate cleavage protein [Paracoccus pantotrophus]
MSRPVIISCAVTGSGNTTGLSPHVPVTPQQIADDAIAAHEAGAAVVHIHVRNPETGAPSRDGALYREVVERIRDGAPSVVINLTTGIGARFSPDEADPNRNASDGMASPEERMSHVLELRPEICSLDVATMNFGAHAFVNTPDHIARIATAVRAAGVKPELEVFDLGHIALARNLIGKGLFDDPPYFQLCLGVPWGAPATSESMQAMKSMLPANAKWSAFGVGAQHFPCVAMSVVNGGHVRVGLEDNLYMSKGVLAESNAPMVARAARIVTEIGATVASPDEARAILGLAPR